MLKTLGVNTLHFIVLNYLSFSRKVFDGNDLGALILACKSCVICLFFLTLCYLTVKPTVGFNVELILQFEISSELVVEYM